MMKTNASRGRMRRCLAPSGSVSCLAFALAVLVAIGSVPARAQERSDTGRRKAPAPVEPAKPAKADAVPVTAADPVFTAAGPRWLAGLGFGVTDAGSLFRAETVSGSPVSWGPAGSPLFEASRFTAVVDPGSVISAHVARRLGAGRWWLRAEAARGASDVAAESLLGQGGEVFFYDRVSFLTASLGAEARLTAWPSHPYGVLGVAYSRLAAGRYDELESAGLGLQAALGYRQQVGRGSFAAEIGLRRNALDIGEFRPSIATEPEPVITYEPREELWSVEFRILGSRAW